MDELIKQGIKVDMVLTDVPYGTTSCAWDSVIPFVPMWDRINKINKNNGAICLFSSQPFTTDLINSNRQDYKYELVWCKNNSTGSLLAKKRPMKAHENIEVFYKEQPTYNPQMVERSEKELKRLSKESVKTQGTEIQAFGGKSSNRSDNKFKMPNSQLFFNCVFNRSKEKTKHPTQKPVDLLEWFIKTYTNEGDTVLDFTMGSGSTGVACMNTGRKFIGIEINPTYCDISLDRILHIDTNIE